MRLIDLILIHCSDSDNANHDDISVIRDWHTSPSPYDTSKPWSDVGYHYFIKSDGTIQEGRKLKTIGAHCYGKNSRSIGICLHGINQFTEPQFRALANLVKHLVREFPTIREVTGHYKYDNVKTCPNFDVEEFLLNYDIKVN